MCRYLWLCMIVFSLLFSGVAFAEQTRLSIPFEWKGNPQATDYRIYQSVDAGKTWEVAAIFAQPTPFPADWRMAGTVPLPSPLPNTGLILYRLSFHMGTHEEMRHESGAWINPFWQPPVPLNLAIP